MKYNPNSTYSVKFKNGTGPVNARWSTDLEKWRINHPLCGLIYVPDSSVTIVGVVLGTG